jgi:hypothetical protein
MQNCSNILLLNHSRKHQGGFWDSNSTNITLIRIIHFKSAYHERNLYITDKKILKEKVEASGVLNIYDKRLTNK